MVLSSVDTREARERALAAGAADFVSKALPDGIRHGCRPPHHGHGGRLGRAPRWRPLPVGATTTQAKPRLSPGEEEALRLYATGFSTAEVAEQMNVQYETAKTYLRRVREKYTKVGRPGEQEGRAHPPRRGRRVPGVVAKLYFRYGAMNSGKSTALLQAAFNYEERGQQVLLAKPAIDSKGDNAIVSRLGMTRDVDFTIAPDEDIYAAFTRERERVIREHGRDVSCLLVDESQFLGEGQVDDLLRIAIQEDVPVLAYGIRTDFQTVAFPGSRRLLEIAHSLEELKTICRCGRKAVFNARTVNGQFVFDGDQVAIDGDAEVSLRVAVRRLLPRGERRRAEPRLAAEARLLATRAGRTRTSPDRRRPKGARSP